MMDISNTAKKFIEDNIELLDVKEKHLDFIVDVLGSEDLSDDDVADILIIIEKAGVNLKQELSRCDYNFVDLREEYTPEYKLHENLDKLVESFKDIDLVLKPTNEISVGEFLSNMRYDDRFVIDIDSFNEIIDDQLESIELTLLIYSQYICCYIYVNSDDYIIECPLDEVEYRVLQNRGLLINTNVKTTNCLQEGLKYIIESVKEYLP